MAESTEPTPIHVLLVEDNEHDARAFKRALGSSETTFKITDCQRGEEALGLLDRGGNSFDIVVTDYSMPGFTGVDLCRELKSRQIEIPLVVLTGTGSERVAVEALKAGAYDYLIKDPDNGYLELLELVLVDVVQRHRDRIIHRKTEENARAILDNAAEGIITINQDCRVETFNPAAEEMFGYTSDEIIGQNINVLMAEPNHSKHDGYVGNYLRTGKAKIIGVRSRELEAQRKDGTVFPIELNISELVVGNSRQFVGSMQDITVRKQAEENLRLALVDAENANLAKSEFLASMSHDLRTPLNAILGFADILTHEYFGPINEKYQEYAGDIHSSGEYLLTLVNDLLDLSTIEAGKQAMVKEKVFTKKIIVECVKIVAEKAFNRGVNLSLKGPDNLPPLHADKRAIKQILLNLLSNAVKFTPEGGKVTVSVKVEKPNTVIKIADTGMGIPAEKLPKLTDPFTRVVGDPYLTEKGWGLGLTITKSLVDLHDGTLDIKSKVGKGTTVTVTLPNGAP